MYPTRDLHADADGGREEPEAAHGHEHEEGRRDLREDHDPALEVVHEHREVVHVPGGSGGSVHGERANFLQGSFSGVSKPNFAEAKVNTHWKFGISYPLEKKIEKALAEIYKMHSFAARKLLE